MTSDAGPCYLFAIQVNPHFVWHIPDSVTHTVLESGEPFLLGNTLAEDTFQKHPFKLR